MIYLTGDTHIPIDIQKLEDEYFPVQLSMSKDDYLIICGDFGGVWDRTKERDQILNTLANRNFTTLFIDGNHENFDILNKMPVSQWHGGKVHFIRDSIIHLMRGQVFEIDGLTFFTMGGGNSTDKAYRVPHRSWWKQEMPNDMEKSIGIENLKLHNNEVDYIITHTAPTDIAIQIRDIHGDELPLNEYLLQIKNTVKFKKWFFGHFHDNRIIDDDFILLYDKFYNLSTQEVELFPEPSKTKNVVEIG
ncbi:MAG: metallophosphoesterase [Ruminococcus sp.]|nr:metallophosphoesterase [Ruminococcus sp.]MCD7800181.1 metallophosphoesterase [Ruminococcus sp.]